MNWYVANMERNQTAEAQVVYAAWLEKIRVRK